MDIIKIFDITTLTNPEIPVWPNTPGFKIWRALDQELGDEVTSSTIQMDVHCGTHIDAPLHFIPGADPATKIELSKCIGDAYVVDFQGISRIDSVQLDKKVPAGTERLLLKTDNSSLFPRSNFKPDFSALTEDGAHWVAERKLKLVGIDYLSIQLFDGDAETHTVLMNAGTVILESINLKDIVEGWYQLICLPLLIHEAEAAPARAILLEY